jgi:hypothetical protein
MCRCSPQPRLQAMRVNAQIYSTQFCGVKAVATAVAFFFVLELLCCLAAGLKHVNSRQHVRHTG